MLISLHEATPRVNQNLPQAHKQLELIFEINTSYLTPLLCHNPLHTLVHTHTHSLTHTLSHTHTPFTLPTTSLSKQQQQQQHILNTHLVSQQECHFLHRLLHLLVSDEPVALRRLTGVSRARVLEHREESVHVLDVVPYQFHRTLKLGTVLDGYCAIQMSGYNVMVTDTL